jgi:hypothetical protein
VARALGSVDEPIVRIIGEAQHGNAAGVWRLATPQPNENAPQGLRVTFRGVPT